MDEEYDENTGRGIYGNGTDRPDSDCPMLSEQRLAEIAAVDAAATPPPWDVIAHSAGHPQLLTVADAHSPICDVVRAYPYKHQANATFIATARQAVPELLAEVQRLQAACATAQSGAWLMARHAPDCRAPLQSSTPGMARVCTCDTGRVLRSAFAGDGADAETLRVQIARRGRGVPLPYPLESEGD